MTGYEPSLEEKCNSTALLLHSVLFAYQKAHTKIVGKGSKAVLQELFKNIQGLIKESVQYEIDMEKTADQNLVIYRSLLRESGYVRDIVLESENEDEYVFKTVDCLFARKVHRHYKDGYICPFAIIAASILYKTKNANVTINESDLNETGSVTRIILHRNKE